MVFVCLCQQLKGLCSFSLVDRPNNSSQQHRSRRRLRWVNMTHIIAYYLHRLSGKPLLHHWCCTGKLEAVKSCLAVAGTLVMLQWLQIEQFTLPSQFWLLGLMWTLKRTLTNYHVRLCHPLLLLSYRW